MPFLMAFCLAFIISQFQSQLPSGQVIMILAVLFFSAVIIHQCSCDKLIKNTSLFFLGFVLGHVWFSVFAHIEISKRLPHHLEKELIAIDIEISSLVVDKGRYLQFNATVINGKNRQLERLAIEKVRLNYYLNADDNSIQPCDRLKAFVKLKRPRGLVNQFGFDYDAYMLHQGIHAKGYIHSIVTLEQNKGICVNRLRQQWRDYLMSQLPKDQAPWILALTIGDKSAFNEEQRRWLSVTGLGHLFVISGLHIGLIAGLVYGFILLLRRWGGGIVFSGDWRLIASCGAIFSAFVYAMLAGFSYSTLRALVAVSTFLLMSATILQASLWFRYFISMAVVLCLFPLAPMSIGFILSYFAVLVLLIALSRLMLIKPKINKIQLFFGLQLAISLAMFPLIAHYFQIVSYISPFINLWVIPVMSLLLIPLSLLTALLFFVGINTDMLLMSLSSAMQAIFFVIDTMIVHWPFPPYQSIALPVSMSLALVLITLAVIMPQMLPLMPQLLIVYGVMLISVYQHPIDTATRNGLEIDILDVGQGTSVIVKTPNHAMLYDTGAGWSEGSMATWAILPVLRHQHVGQLDKVMVSHLDNDHVGGLSDILVNIAVNEVTSSSLIEDIEPRFSSCFQGQQWTWDAVTFSVLHPKKGQDYQGNNSSCVLMIEYAGKRILLAGDIEKKAEKRLLDKKLLKPVDVVLIPHHGSNTSSTEAFIDHIYPAYGVVSSGYLNRYHHPHQRVINRYHRKHVEIFNTAVDGAIRIAVNAQDGLVVTKARDSYQRFWYGH